MLRFFIKNSFKAILISFIICSICIDCLAQSPYDLDGSKESILIGSSAALLTFGGLKYKNLKPFTPEQIGLLNRDDVIGIDRPATFNHSAAAKKYSDILLYSSAAIPLTMLLDNRSRKDFGKTAMFTLQTILMNSAITSVTKSLAKRTRPFVYNDAFGIELKLKKSARASFFSGHASTVTSMYFLTAKLYSDYYPDSDWKPVVWSTAIVVPALTGLLRVKAGKHYFTDVLTGFIVGAAVGYLIPDIH